jgi:hypothetical protein
MGDDIDVVWLTYDEAAARLRVKPDSVRRRAAARKWHRRRGNDGLARVGIPLSIIPEPSPDVTPDVMGDENGLRERLAAAEAENALLRVQVEDLRVDRDAWRTQAERLAPVKTSIWARLFAR